MLRRFLTMMLALFAAALVIAVEGMGRTEVPADEVVPGKEAVTRSDADRMGADRGIRTNAVVLRVVDGDTFIADVDGVGEATIRMLGVNTPETVDPRKPAECFGKEASDYTKRRLDGAPVYLEADPLADEIDRYGRLLRVVQLDDSDFNAELIREGYAYALTSFPMSPDRKHDYKMFEQDAMAAERGLWARDACGDSV
jgi:micrococcal nuclease